MEQQSNLAKSLKKKKKEEYRSAFSTRKDVTAKSSLQLEYWVLKSVYPEDVWTECAEWFHIFSGEPFQNTSVWKWICNLIPVNPN